MFEFVQCDLKILCQLNYKKTASSIREKIQGVSKRLLQSVVYKYFVTTLNLF